MPEHPPWAAKRIGYYHKYNKDNIITINIILIRTTQLRLEDIKKILHDDIHYRVRSLDFEIVIARLNLSWCVINGGSTQLWKTLWLKNIPERQLSRRNKTIFPWFWIILVFIGNWALMVGALWFLIPPLILKHSPIRAQNESDIICYSNVSMQPCIDSSLTWPELTGSVMAVNVLTWTVTRCWQARLGWRSNASSE